MIQFKKYLALMVLIRMQFRKQISFYLITKLIWDKPLSFEASPDGFHLCGDVSQSLGREAYIQWCRENDIDY